jgi:hypothetical protein
MKEYSLVWKQFSKNSDIGKHLEVSDDSALPYFIDGVDKENFDKRIPFEFNQMHLLRGVIVGYSDHPPTVNMQVFKYVAPMILNDLNEYFKCTSLEELIYEIASHIRKENGDHVSLEALLNGIEICPASSKIKLDCCIDLFNLLERNEFPYKEYGKQKLFEVINLIDKSQINPDFLDTMDEIEEWLLKDGCKK